MIGKKKNTKDFGDLVKPILELEGTMKVYATAKAQTYSAACFDSLLIGFHKSETAFDGVWNKWDLVEEMIESKFPLMKSKHLMQFELANQNMCKRLLRSKNLFTGLKERVLSFNDPTLDEFHDLILECKAGEDEAARSFSEVVQTLREIQYYVADIITS